MSTCDAELATTCLDAAPKPAGETFCTTFPEFRLAALECGQNASCPVDENYLCEAFAEELKACPDLTCTVTPPQCDAQASQQCSKYLVGLDPDMKCPLIQQTVDDYLDCMKEAGCSAEADEMCNVLSDQVDFSLSNCADIACSGKKIQSKSSTISKLDSSGCDSAAYARCESWIMSPQETCEDASRYVTQLNECLEQSGCMDTLGKVCVAANDVCPDIGCGATEAGPNIGIIVAAIGGTVGFFALAALFAKRRQSHRYNSESHAGYGQQSGGGFLSRLRGKKPSLSTMDRTTITPTSDFGGYPRSNNPMYYGGSPQY